MDVRKLIAVFNKMLNSKNDQAEYRRSHITKVEIYYEDDIIITIKDKNDDRKN